MTIKETINKAIEGGWAIEDQHQKIEIIGETPKDYRLKLEIHLPAVFFDPTFWQSLGKALGWENSNQTYVQRPYTNWRVQWHRFIDHLAEGKDAESFFENLPNPK